MRVLIQDNRSKKFFTPAGEWVQHARDAGDFQSYRHAYAVARETMTSAYNIMLFSTLGGFLFSVDQGRP